MKYTVDKGIEVIQKVLILSDRDYRLSGYMRAKECKLVNSTTLINYLIRVEYELLEDAEIIVNLTVKAQYRDKVNTIRVIEEDCLHILDLVRLPADVLPFVTALLLENSFGCCKALFVELLDDYCNAIKGGAEPDERDFDGLRIMRTVLSEDFCSICSLYEAIQEPLELDEDTLYIRFI